MIRLPLVRRILVAVWAIVVLGLLTMPPVSAAAPVRVKLDLPPATISGLCTFDVAYVAVVNNEYNIVFSDSAGNQVKQITEGHLVLTFTDTSNGHSLTLNISGPGITTFNPDGSQTIVFLGNGILFTNNQIILNSGRVVIVAPDALSPGVIVSASGVQRDFCQLLG
jgi:hypothetical protein